MATSGGIDLEGTYQQFHQELIDGGATPRVARCYQEQMEALPVDELEELFSEGELSKAANVRLKEFNAETEATCVGKGGAFKANPSPEEQEGTIKALAKSLGLTLEAQGIPDDVISCVTEGVEAEPYDVLIEVTKHEPGGQEALGKVGKECGYSP